MELHDQIGSCGVVSFSLFVNQMPADIKLKWQQEAGGTDAHYSQTFIKPLLDYKYLHLHFTLTHIIRNTRLGTHSSTGRLTSHQPAVIHDIWAISNHCLVHYQETCSLTPPSISIWWNPTSSTGGCFHWPNSVYVTSQRPTQSGTWLWFGRKMTW